MVIEAEQSLRRERVVHTLGSTKQEPGAQKLLLCDKGSSFTSQYAAIHILADSQSSSHLTSHSAKENQALHLLRYADSSLARRIGRTALLNSKPQTFALWIYVDII